MIFLEFHFELPLSGKGQFNQTAEGFSPFGCFYTTSNNINKKYKNV